MQTVYLIRHATPDWSRTDLIYHLPPGPPLTLQGAAEAQALGDFLHQVRVQRIYTSPLERCHRTAEVAAQPVPSRAGSPGIQVIVEPMLAEQQPGESFDLLRARFLPVFEKAWLESRGNGLGPQPVALLTHGGPVAFLLLELGLAPDQLRQHRARFDHHNPLPPAGAWEVTRPDPGSPWRLRLAFTPPHES